MTLLLPRLLILPCLIVPTAMILFPSMSFADALENLKPKRLEAVRQSVAMLGSLRKEVPRSGPLQEHRANLHVHSHWSHDSVGTVDEIVEAARATGTSVLMFTEHPADYLKRWDELTQIAPHTGISANDAHQNVGFVIRWIEGDKGRLEDALGEKGLDMDLAALPDIEALQKDQQPGDVIYSMFLDRFYCDSLPDLRALRG